MTVMMTNLLHRIESPDPTFDADAVIQWPVGWLDHLTVLGVLAETASAECVRCDACDHDHVEQVQWIDVPGRFRRAFVACSAYGRVQVDPVRLKRWTVRGEQFAT